MFNTQLFAFIDELIYLFPAATKLVILREKMNLLKIAKSETLIIRFLEIVYPFKKQIFEMDDNFFKTQIKTNSLMSTANIKIVGIEQIFSVPTLWENTSESNKKAIWKYFQVLILLCEQWFHKK